MRFVFKFRKSPAQKVNSKSKMAGPDGGKSTPMSTNTLQTLQNLTKKLQEERDKLYIQVEDLEDQLTKEKNAKQSLQNELEVKELELVQIQQLSKEKENSLLDRINFLEKELEDSKAQQKIVMNKSTTILNEMKQLEAKLRKETTTKKSLLTEIDQLKVDIQAIDSDRDQLISKTEADATRVRELWQQIMLEYENQKVTFEQELATLKDQKDQFQQNIKQQKEKIDSLQSQVTQKDEINTSQQTKIKSLEQTIEALQDQMKQANESDRSHDRKTTSHLMKIQELKNKLVIANQNVEMAMKEKKISEQALEKAKEMVDQKEELLIVLQSEYSELLDKYEHAEEMFKQKTIDKEAKATIKVHRLEKEKQFAIDIASLRRKEIGNYKNVLQKVNTKLNEVKARHAAFEMNAWTTTTNITSTPLKEADRNKRSLYLKRID
jgi:chromosome segregation ATPase